MTTANECPPVILLVEDDPGDQELTRRALAEAGIECDLRIADDGEAALDYLFRRGRFEDPASSPRPALILLDLNMPKVNGKQVLEQFQEAPQLSDVPVIVLTTSDQEQDMTHCYGLGSMTFITKPMTMEDFVQVVQTWARYWFDVVAAGAG